MNKKVSFSIWYVFLAIWAVILVHDFIMPCRRSKSFPTANSDTRHGRQSRRGSVSSHTLTGKLKPEGEAKEPKLFSTDSG